jgi:hypothetical protein
MQDEIVAWARAEKVVLISIEPEIEGSSASDNPEEIPLDNDPEYILRLFADAEEIDDRMFEVGIELLREVIP